MAGTTEIKTQHITLSVSDGTAMPAYAAQPAGEGDYPGILVYQEAFGVNAHIRDVTERFARQGFVAIAPALFHRTDANFEGSYTDFSSVMPHMQALTDEGLIADIRASYCWLTAADGGKAKIVASVGYCLGGKVSFLTDSVVPVKASVSYYGGGIAPDPERGSLGLLDRTKDLNAPILLFWGGKDKHLGLDQRQAIEASLIAEGKPYVQVIFSDASHGFFCDVRASYHRPSADQSWALALAFLKDNLQ